MPNLSKTARRARRARTMTRREYEDELRRRLNAGTSLRHLTYIERHLRARHGEMEQSEIAALRLLADVSFKKLGKLLPDLKAVELSADGDGDSGLTIVVNDIGAGVELHARDALGNELELKALGLDVPPEEVQPAEEGVTLEGEATVVDPFDAEGTT